MSFILCHYRRQVIDLFMLHAGIGTCIGQPYRWQDGFTRCYVFRRLGLLRHKIFISGWSPGPRELLLHFFENIA